MSRKRLARLTDEILATLKYEFGLVGVKQVDPGCNTFSESADSSSSGFKTYSLEISTAELEIKVVVDDLDLAPEVTTQVMLTDDADELVHELILGKDRPVTNAPLEFAIKNHELDCTLAAPAALPDTLEELCAGTHPADLLKQPATSYGQRLILRFPLRRAALDWELFTREEIYLFWQKLMLNDKFNLAEAELLAVFARVPLNLISKLQIDPDRGLRMFLHQQALKPKTVFLITGRIKKSKKLVQAVITKKELSGVKKSSHK